MYLDFASRLTPNDTVLTFNYDTLMEQSLDELGKPYTLTPEWWLSNKRHGTKGSGTGVIGEYVDVIKLHGSIDWYDRRFYDSKREYFRQQNASVTDNDPIFGPKAWVQTESLSRGDVDSHGAQLLTRVRRVPDIRHVLPLLGQHDLVPFILPPAHDKLLGQDPVSDLWENMHRSLDYACVCMIGYSMPEYDGYAYEAIGRLLVLHQNGKTSTSLGQSRTPVQIIDFGGSEAEVRGRYQFLDGKARVWHKGFDRQSLDWMDWGEQPTRTRHRSKARNVRKRKK